MITWGINALGHDASIAVVEDGNIKFWKRSSEYTGIVGDEHLNHDIVQDAMAAGTPDNIVWFEQPWIKKSRQLYAGQLNWAFNFKELPSVHLRSLGLGKYPVRYLPHHLSHAAAGFLTSPYKDATVVVLDAIGEWESASIWYGSGTKLTKLWSRSYPTSLGLFYSAFTHLIGLKPLGQEHVLQQWSSLGDDKRFFREVYSYWNDNWTLRENLHKGVKTWPYAIVDDQDRYDIAAAVQTVFELQADWVMVKARSLSTSKNLVYMGGCAMNSKYNNYLPSQWDSVKTLSRPGDASSSIGAALYHQQVRGII